MGTGTEEDDAGGRNGTKLVTVVSERRREQGRVRS